MRARTAHQNRPEEIPNMSETKTNAKTNAKATATRLTNRLAVAGPAVS